MIDMGTKSGKKEPHYISNRFKNVVHIHCPLFEQSFWVFLKCKTALDFKREAERVLPKGASVEVKPTNSGRFTVFDFGKNGTIGLIWGKDDIHVTHECHHAAIWSLDDRGVPITAANDEIVAYYQSFLLREIRRHS